MTMNGMAAERTPTVSQGAVLYMVSNTPESRLPSTVPRGPRTHSAMGVQMMRKMRGLRKALSTLGDTLSPKSSAHFITGAISRMGSTEEV